MKKIYEIDMHLTPSSSVIFPSKNYRNIIVIIRVLNKIIETINMLVKEHNKRAVQETKE